MARKRKGGRKRGSLINRAANLVIAGVAFSPGIGIAMDGSSNKLARLAELYSAGMSSTGRFNQSLALTAYGPMVGALVLYKLKGAVLRGHPLPI